ncbi:MAG: hypothetical protein WC242_04255 [Candidatus Paceibacterota bacterium]|jgi:hypothetical protein
MTEKVFCAGENVTENELKDAGYKKVVFRTEGYHFPSFFVRTTGNSIRTGVEKTALEYDVVLVDNGEIDNGKILGVWKGLYPMCSS